MLVSRSFVVTVILVKRDTKPSCLLVLSLDYGLSIEICHGFGRLSDLRRIKMELQLKVYFLRKNVFVSSRFFQKLVLLAVDEKTLGNKRVKLASNAKFLPKSMHFLDF